MGIDTRLYKDHKYTKEARKAEILACIHVIDDIRALAQTELTEAVNKGLKESNFDSPNWSEHRAYLDGVAKGIQQVINLLPSNEETNKV